MVILKERTKKEQKQTQLSAGEVHLIWVKAQSRYVMIDNILFLSGFVHDTEFKLFLSQLQDVYQKEVEAIEQELKKYSIKSPEPNKTDIEALISTEIISDKQIARNIYGFAQLALSKCLKALQVTMFNDDLRKIIIELTKLDIDTFFKLVDYLELKGWLENPPLYPNIKKNETVGAGEIWELWQHLYYRYLHLNRTKIFLTHVSDLDFQAILTAGTNVLEKQIKHLEQLLIDYGISLPDKYPKNIPAPETKEAYDDERIFKSLLNSMKNAITVHGFALQEIMINKNLRNLFKNLLIDEIDLVDKLFRYGKVKGWAPLVPLYRT